jgi:hypothetical protein
MLKNEVTYKNSKLHQKVHNAYPSRIIVTVIKSRRIRWLEYVIDMGGGHTKCWLENFKERNLIKQLQVGG